MNYSVQPRDRLFEKGYGLLYFGKNMIKNVSVKYSQKLLHHTKKFAIDAFKTSSKRVIQKKIISNW